MEKNKNVKEITIKIEGKEWQDALDKAFEKANKKVKIDGFRQGKAPKEVFIKNINNQIYYQYLNKPKKSYPIDIFIPVLHGYGTEDGTVVGFLDIYQAIYTCSDLIPSAIIQDKVATKAMLKLGNFPNVEGIVAIEGKTIEEVPFPAIVKPAYLGSSIGIKVVKNNEELEQALNVAYKYTNKVLIEKAIINFKEYNCAVIKDHNELITSTIEEVKHDEEIL